jgi:predicted nucleotidyltransferase
VTSFGEIVRALDEHRVRFVVIGVWGANYYATGTTFVTRDQDLFLPLDATNLLRAWQACERAGLRLNAGDEELDHPRDLALANAVVNVRALTGASDDALLQIDLSLVMGAFAFDDVWARRRTFRTDGVATPVAHLEDIVASKRAADRPKDRLFLAAHEEQLRRLLGGA